MRTEEIALLAALAIAAVLLTSGCTATKNLVRGDNALLVCYSGPQRIFTGCTKGRVWPGTRFKDDMSGDWLRLVGTSCIVHADHETCRDEPGSENPKEEN